MELFPEQRRCERNNGSVMHSKNNPEEGFYFFPFCTQEQLFFLGKIHTTNCGLPQCIKREVEYITPSRIHWQKKKTTGKPYRNTRGRCALLLLNYGRLTEVNKDNIKMKVEILIIITSYTKGNP